MSGGGVEETAWAWRIAAAQVLAIFCAIAQDHLFTEFTENYIPSW